MEKVKITFINGTVMEAEVNGSSLIMEKKPDFPQGLSLVTVTGRNSERVYKNAETIECASVDGRYWFAFREVPEAERAARQVQANIEYIAMMAGIDLEEA